jgi:hypothetical protein
MKNVLATRCFGKGFSVVKWIREEVIRRFFHHGVWSMVLFRAR